MRRSWWKSPQQMSKQQGRRKTLPGWLLSLGLHLLIYALLLLFLRDRSMGIGASEHGFQVGIFSDGSDGEGDGGDRGGDGGLGDQPAPAGDTGTRGDPGEPVPDSAAKTAADTAAREAAVAQAIGDSLDQLTRTQFGETSNAGANPSILTSPAGDGPAEAATGGLPASIGGTRLLGGGGGSGGRSDHGNGRGGGGSGGTGPGMPGSGIGFGRGHGGTRFFQIEAQGHRFVYVVDHSGSMGFDRQLAAAKAELQASLQGLESSHQFQIIFYNDVLHEFHLRGTAGLNWASDINKTLARQFIHDIQPDGGTSHMNALTKAILYKPENIFFLTDADEPRLSAKDLADIKRVNAGKSRIHCVEFGKGGNIGVENFLQRLARENGGSYRYQDITQFGAH